METFLYYIRDHLVGTHYFIYAFVLLFFMFAIIGYLFKQKYAKYQIVLNNAQTNVHQNSKTKKGKSKKTKATPMPNPATTPQVKPTPIPNVAAPATLTPVVNSNNQTK